MFIGRNKANAMAQAKANADRTGYAWCIFQDHYGAWRCEPEAPQHNKPYIYIEPARKES